MTFAPIRHCARGCLRPTTVAPTGESADFCWICWRRAGDCNGSSLPQLGGSGHRGPNDGLGGERAYLFGKAEPGKPRRGPARTRVIVDFARKRQPGWRQSTLPSGLLVRAVPPFRLSTLTRNRCGLTSLCPGGGGRVGDGSQVVQGGVPPVECGRHGTRMFRCTRCMRAEAWWGVFTWTCIRVRARTSVLGHTDCHWSAWPSTARTGLICNFPRGDENDPGCCNQDVVTYFHEFGHLMHAILWRPHRVGRALRICHRGDLSKCLADAGRIFPR